MKEMGKRKPRATWLMVLCMIIGVIAGLVLMYQRIHVEVANRTIENVVDYDGVIRSAAYTKESPETAFAKLKAAGVTAVAIYDTTLQKSNDRGVVRVLGEEEARHIPGLETVAQVPGKTYVMAVKGKEGYLQEIYEDALHRIGRDKTELIPTTEGTVLVLDIPESVSLDMPLGLSRLQALEAGKQGFHLVLRPKNFRNVTADDVAFVFNRMKGVPNITGMVFVGKEVLGYPDHMDLTIDYGHKMHIPFVAIEAVNQLQYQPQLGLAELARAEHYRMGRLYTVTKDEMKKLSPTELVQWFYISDMERNIRYNLFPLYSEGINGKTAIDASAGYMADVTKRLEARGYHFGKASIFPDYQPKGYLVTLVILGLVGAFTTFISYFYRMGAKGQAILAAILFILSLILTHTRFATTILQLWALVATVTIPVLAILIIMDRWADIKVQNHGRWSAYGKALLTTIVTAAIASMGGIFVSTILGRTEFFMEYAIFRGVKLAFVLPVILTVIAYFIYFPVKGQRLNTLGAWRDAIGRLLKANIKVGTLVILGIILVIAWIFVGRSGHTAGVPVPHIELVIRRFLEDTMYARPREKEFIIGYPALMLATYGFYRQWPRWAHALCTVIAVMGVASMVETFCHIRTPLLMSIFRGIDGLILGLIVGTVGLIIVGIVRCLWRQFSRGGGHV